MLRAPHPPPPCCPFPLFTESSRARKSLNSISRYPTARVALLVSLHTYAITLHSRHQQTTWDRTIHPSHPLIGAPKYPRAQNQTPPSIATTTIAKSKSRPNLSAPHPASSYHISYVISFTIKTLTTFLSHPRPLSRPYLSTSPFPPLSTALPPSLPSLFLNSR